MNIKGIFSFDVHSVQAGKDSWLGGVQIPHTKGVWGIVMPIYTNPMASYSLF